ncbi:MAG: S8 family serine peptidase, partial [Bacteroidales bacterium]|nr:S8 family serine peptidase [Bacteroidales bacterium]
MKKIVLIVMLLCINAVVSAQNNNFYYANGTAQYWEEDRNSVNIIVGNIENIDTLVYRLKSQFRDVNDEILFSNEDNNIIVNSSSLSSRNINDIIDNISISANDVVFFSYSKIINESHIWLTNEVYVKLRDSLYYSTHILPVISQQQNINIYYEGDDEYRIVCSTEEQVISIANQLYNPIYTIYSTPDFYSEIDLCTNDEYFDRQWNLENIGQDGGTIGVDIKAVEAWNFLNKVIGEPGSNIKVAVIDDGVEEHDDLYLNGGVSKVLEGYTANGNGTGRPLSNSFHGQMCAGIIAAVHNDIGIAGIASNARIVPFRIFTNIGITFSGSNIANAIKKSSDDFSCLILSNSWKFSSPNDKITDAINHVALNGRNGKGCFVVFASGNDASYVAYPAYLNCVVAVGAVDRNGFKIDYSNYGNNLDIVAPSDPVYTTDRMGNYGMSNDLSSNPNYYHGFNGTSAACPHVSGVATLMLSVNPNLTRLEITDIIKRTAQKVGGYNYQIQNNDPEMTWCPETGYGLIDAHRAVVESLLYGQNITLNGSREMYLCDDYTFSCDIINPEAFSYEWTHSNNLTVLSSNNNNITLKPISSGSAWVKLNIYSENRLIRTLEINDIIINNAYVDNLVPISLDTLNIFENTTLSNNNHFLVFDAVIEKDVTLTITGDVYCSDLASIKIKPGGKLIIDGGLLTSVCYTKKWQGIEVWGIDTLHQFMMNGKYQQGYLELKNGATIENAVCAVELWNPGNYSSEGGIIYATDAVFRNNAKAVHAINYTNYVPTTGNSSAYNSLFKGCTFIVDRDYVGNEIFYKHVDLDRVNGIRFQGCNFSVDRNLANVSQWCSGLAAYNAGFAIDSYCSNNTVVPCPDEYLTRSSFDGFHSGVYVSGGASAYTYRIRDAYFTNNDRGIYTENSGYATILFNDFIVGTKADCSFGIYMNGTTGFCIEENNFVGNENSLSDNYGIGVRNSKSANNIYRNTFESLDCGNIAIGQNKINSISASVKQGALSYSCNTNISNINDFCVIKENSSGNIAQNQGSTTLPAGNTFSGSQYHFYNDGESVVTYYYNGNNSNQIPNDTKLYRVSKVSTSSVNACGSHYGSGSVVRSESELTTLENDYLTSLAAYNEMEQFYSNRIDGGNTQAEVADINTATAD